MVYLIRHARVERDWDKMEGAAKALTDFWAKQPEVRRAEVWGNIAGPQDEYRFVALFDSLADEEKFAMRLWNDKGYEAAMTEFTKVFGIGEDELVRSF